MSIILGLATSMAIAEAFPIAEENQVVAISSTAGARGLSGFGDYVFRNPLTSEKQGNVAHCLSAYIFKKETPPNTLKWVIMKLTKVRIKNYKCIHDSTEFDIADITCLVGKNESGKTAILEALDKFNPFDTAPGFDRLDYPVENIGLKMT